MPKTIKLLDKGSAKPKATTATRKKSPYRKADQAVAKFVNPNGTKKIIKRKKKK